jgi:hypothetical protein
MNRSAAISLALVAAALLPVGALAAHKPGHGPGAGGDALTIAAKPNPVVFGGTVSLTGRLTAADRAGKNVVLESDPFPYEGDFENLRNARTSPSGAYALTDKPTVNTRYRVRQGSLVSPVVTVLVRIRVGLRVGDTTPRAGRRVRFTGRACPAHVGSLVRIQRQRRSGGWATVARTRVKAATVCSRYAKRVRVNRDGAYRAVVAGHADHARGISRTRFLDVG